MTAPVTKEFKYGRHTIRIETGEIARQATAAVMVSMDETVVLVTAVVEKEPDEVRDFFPLTVNYLEKTYAAGRIPGGYFRREGRPTENETLTSRLIDRPLRPLFPDGFTNEIQVVATVLSMDPQINPDIPSMIGASAAMALSGAPFNGPIGAARVGYKDGQYILNPSATELDESALDLVVAGTEKAVLMVESEAKLLSEEVMLGAVVFGHEQMQVVINAIKDMVKQVGVTPLKWVAAKHDEAFKKSVVAECSKGLTEAYGIGEKQARYARIDETTKATVAKLRSEDGSNERIILNIIEEVKSQIVRGRIIEGAPRIDGRDNKTVRPITIRIGVLPRTHGSALFTRGETQALVVTTLGTERDAQIVDALEGVYKEPFMLQYNFPPYCVGEMGQVGSPKRREIGHGRLAKRGVVAVMPDESSFPYSVRVVSEITESNGSSSMASVCGSSLSLMDAGVALKAPVAGIAMGLIKEADKFAVITDILGDEDHLGDMDFKVAGSKDGISALQMDIKIDGITKEIMKVALEQAKAGRLHILEKMNAVLSSPRETMSKFAPRYVTLKIHPDKIRDVIGKGGATIRAITEETGCAINIDNDGTVKIASSDVAAADEARRQIEQLTADVEVGAVYEGKVSKLMDFGAFVTILPGRDGLVHVSQISHERVENVSDKLSEGDSVRVKVLEIDKQGRIRLSMKALAEN